MKSFIFWHGNATQKLLVQKFQHKQIMYAVIIVCNLCMLYFQETHARRGISISEFYSLFYTLGLWGVREETV